MIEILVTWITNLISAIGYSGLLLLMALESTVMPIPSEAVMPFAGFLVSLGKMNLALVILFSTIGCLLGSMTSYYIGYYGGEKIIRKFGKYLLLDEESLKKSEEWFSKKGGITIFIGRFIPGIRHVISIPAGMGKMNISKFAFFTLLGAGIWNTVLVYLGIILEKNWKIVYEYTKYVDILLIILITIGLIYYIRKIIISLRK